MVTKPFDMSYPLACKVALAPLPGPGTFEGICPTFSGGAMTPKGAWDVSRRYRYQTAILPFDPGCGQNSLYTPVQAEYNSRKKRSIWHEK